MVSQAVIELALKIVGADKAVAELDRVTAAEKRAENPGGFSGQLTGTKTQGRQVEETNAISAAQDQLNNKLAIGKEHSIFTVQSKALELQGVKDIETATAKLAEKKLAEIAAGKVAQQGLASFVKSLAADAGIAAAAVTAAMQANKVIWGESLAMANKLAERDGEFAKATEGSRYAMALLSGDFSGLAEDARNTWQAMGDYASEHAGVVGGLVAGPIGAAVGSYIQKLKDIVGAADEAWDAADESQKKLDFLARSIADEHAQMLESGKAFYEATTTADNAYTANRLANAAKIHAAEAALQNGRNQRAGQTGGEQAVNAVGSQATAAADSEAQAQQVVDAALARNDIAWREFFEKKFVQGTDQEVAAANQKAQESQSALDIAQSNLEALKKENELKLQNSAEEALNKGSEDAEKAFTKNAEALRDKLDQMAIANGGVVDPAWLNAKARTDEILADKKATVEELKNLKLANDSARQSRLAADQTTQKYFQTLATDAQSTNTKLQDLQGQINAIREAQAYK